MQADSRDAKPWGNRTYPETVRVKDQFPEQFRILAEMAPHRLEGKVPALELYDLLADPDEMHNLADNAAARAPRDRLYAALRNWSVTTGDASAPLPASP